MPIITYEIYSGAPPPGPRIALLDTRAAAAYLGVRMKSLFNWRQRRCGPTYLRVGGERGVPLPDQRTGSVFYPLAELDRFLEAMAVRDRRLPRPTVGRLPGGHNKPKRAA